MKKRTCLFSYLAGFMLLFALSAHAQLIFVPQSGAPATESCLNGFPMTRVGITPPPEGSTTINYIVSPISGTISSSVNMVIYVDADATDDLYDGAFYLPNISGPDFGTVTLTMPEGTRAFSFKGFNLFNASNVTIEVTSTDGTSSVGPMPVSAPGSGARGYYGFYTADPSTTIRQVSITAKGLLGIGQLRIYQGEYISPSQAAFAGPLQASIPTVCAGQPVSLNATGTGNSFVITGPDNYVFSTVYRSIGTHSFRATGITQPGQYTLKSSLGCTQSVNTITLTNCP
ncbi:hypothetical protein [Arsenicibacter rosenii]|uniref:Bacterial Ig-like domain-containing protein n=1 Tax=Arsenicibacter rosenii TaxID=1750698 RepID=A0A1S2VRB7_9BACT|nr:hypothetical protein [Arsenicibacter rosenii]OIN60755.1 hypothetical protein BLX24_01235 [Arsenicibacter rosenii]